MSALKHLPDSEPAAADRKPVAVASSGKPSAVPGGITPEIMAVIEEAASAFMGRDVRILSVKLQSKADMKSSSWADQGRAVHQTSHNLVQRGH